MAMSFVLYLVFIQVGFTAVTSITYSCLSNATCGCSLNSAVLTKIVGGEQAGIDTWGWAVSIRIGNSHICGGSLISSTFILTAAHCFTSLKSISSLKINVGSKYLSRIRQQRSVSNIYILQNYDSATHLNDIAIIHLSSPINMNDRSIALICLPSKIDAEYPLTDTTVIAIGWGILSSESKTSSNTLQQVTLKTISKADINCQDLVHNDNLQFCANAQGGGKDTCQGDSGGPLMMFSNDQWILVGITSYGIGCALTDYPGVYTRVSYYIDWILCFITNNMSLLLILSIFDVITSTVYTCDRQAPCGCSKRSTVVLSRIIGGEAVNIPYSWGWMASLRRDDEHQCGASLVTSTHVITAAHCVKDITSLSRLSLNFGITNLSNIGQLRNVTKIHIHPLYDERLYKNDLAILHLHKPIDSTDSYISFICLPTTLDFDLKIAEYPPVGDNLVAIGWGSLNPFKRIASPILQQVTVQAIADTDTSCVNTINDDVVQFCAGVPEGGKDTCQGDSGGPLMLFKNRRWQLIGITSYGELCGSPGLPGIYTRIAYYDSYIHEIINSDDVYLPEAKQMDKKNQPRSNTKTLYQKSIIQLFPMYIFFVYRKFFL